MEFKKDEVRNKTIEEELEEISKELEMNKEAMRKELGYSFEHFELSELLKPNVSFVDEMLKIFDIKNLPVENNFFENKFREKRLSDQEPYFNYKCLTPDDSLNDAHCVFKETTQKPNKPTSKCEIQIYKTDRPFFLRPCSSYKSINSSIENVSFDESKKKLKVLKKKRWTSESPVKNYIYGKKKPERNQSMQNLNPKKEIKMEPLKTTVSCSNIEPRRPILRPQRVEISKNKSFSWYGLMGYFTQKFGKNSEPVRQYRASRIPIRKGSSLERKTFRIEHQKIVRPKSERIETFSKDYESIFNKMKAVDKSNRLANLLKIRNSYSIKQIDPQLRNFILLATTFLILTIMNSIFVKDLFIY